MSCTTDCTCITVASGGSTSTTGEARSWLVVVADAVAAVVRMWKCDVVFLKCEFLKCEFFFLKGFQCHGWGPSPGDGLMGLLTFIRMKWNQKRLTNYIPKFGIHSRYREIISRVMGVTNGCRYCRVKLHFRMSTCAGLFHFFFFFFAQEVEDHRICHINTSSKKVTKTSIASCNIVMQYTHR